MTLVYVDGFEDTSSFIANGTPVLAAGRTGLGAFLDQTSESYQYRFPTMTSPITFGVAVKLGVLGGTTTSPHLTMLADDLAQVHVALTFLPTGAVQAQRSTATPLATSAAGVVTAGVWYYVEAQVSISDTTGTIIVRVNGVEVINASALDTRQGAGTNVISAIEFRGGGGATIGQETLYDDFYLKTGAGETFLGDCRVETLYPNGNGASSQWLGSDGDSTNNYLLVDETGTPNTADYVASSTTGQQDLYTMTDLVSTAQAVLAVQPTVYAARTDGTTRSVKLLTRRASTAASAALALDNVTAFSVTNVLTTDPETGVAWTPTNVNALQVGVETA